MNQEGMTVVELLIIILLIGILATCATKHYSQSQAETEQETSSESKKSEN